jgi:hypothetical protein
MVRGNATTNFYVQPWKWYEGMQLASLHVKDEPFLVFLVNTFMQGCQNWTGHRTSELIGSKFKWSPGRTVFNELYFLVFFIMYLL